jgi:surfeit locus 1 family protein
MLRLIVPSIASALVIVLAFYLGAWQNRRGDEKLLLKTQIEAAQQLPPISAVQVNALTHEKRRVSLSGTWLHEQTIFIDNRTHKGKAGFHVLTPLKIRTGTVLVLRGWIERDIADRNRIPVLPNPTELFQITGLTQSDLLQSYSLGRVVTPGKTDRIWQTASRAAFSDWSGIVLNDYVLRQTEQGRNWQGQEVPDGLVRDWAAFNVDVDKHRGYALQWYSLAALSALLWVWFVVIKRFLRKSGDENSTDIEAPVEQDRMKNVDK